MPTATTVLPEVLMNTVLGKLYHLLTSGDGTVPKSEDNFFSWCTPGVPFVDDDFNFLTQGLTGVAKPQPAAEGTEPMQLTEEKLDKLRAVDTGQLYQQAESFARFIDVIPDASGINQQLVNMNIKSDEGTLSEVYDFVLRFSQVAEIELPPDVIKKIAKFRKLLQVEKEKEDLITGEKTKVLEPSPLVIAYNDKMQAWMEAALEYNTARIDALVASTPQAVHNWAINSKILRKKPGLALNDWISNGYKDDYERIAAYIDQVSSRDLTLLKAQYKEDLENAKLTGSASGSDFLYSALTPASFYKSKGWTRFTFTNNDYTYYSKAENNSWGGGGGITLGLFSLGGAAGGETTTINSQLDMSNFNLSFLMTQVPIVRPWFKSRFLTSKSWRFDPNNPESKGDFLSDGNRPPAKDSQLPAYPTSVIFIKDLTLTFGNVHDVFGSDSSSLSAGGAIGYGPFFIGGSYGSGAGKSDVTYHSDSQGIHIDGMQAIGFRCHLLPKSPNPDPAIKKWV